MPRIISRSLKLILNLKIRMNVFCLFRRGVFRTALLAALLPLSATAQEAGVTLTGTAHDGTGIPAVGVTVAVEGPVNRRTQSDRSGGFAFTDLPPGEYVIRIEGLGLAMAERRVVLHGEAVTVTLVVERTALAVEGL